MSKRSQLNFSNTDIIVLDEASICQLELFTVIDKLFRIHKGIDRPFGGLQIGIYLLYCMIFSDMRRFLSATANIQG